MTFGHNDARNDTPATRIVFLHIPKAAGTSVNSLLLPILLAAGYPVDTICPSRGPDIENISDGCLETYRIFSGHFYYDHLCRVPEPKRVFTVLREPRARLLSLYNFLKSFHWEVINKLDANEVTAPLLEAHGKENLRLAKSLSLIDYLRCKDFGVQTSVDNVATRHLIGAKYADNDGRLLLSDDDALNVALDNLECFDAVGFTEHTGAFLRRVENVLGMKLPDILPTTNDFSSLVVNNPYSYEKIEVIRSDEVDSATEEVIFHNIRIDRKLYAAALNKFGPQPHAIR